MLNTDEREFIKKNKEYWNAFKIEKKKSDEPIFLVEGQLSGAPNYLLRTAVSAKAIERATGAKAVVIINSDKEMEKKAKALYSSFGINRFINIKETIIPNHVKARAVLECLKLFLINRPIDILELSYKGIKMGHLIYDDILHDDIYDNNKRKHYTVKRIDFYCLKHVYKFFVKAYIYWNLLSDKTIMAYVSTHTVYCEYGILPFLAVDRNIPVVYSDDFSHAIIEDSRELYPHDRIKKRIINIIKSTQKNILINKAEDDFNQRICGIGNVDVKLAYCKEKRSYSKRELSERLGLNSQYPNVFIFAHVFRDSPHVSSKLLYQDYYDWLENTLLYAEKIKGVNWIVKEHPSANPVYKEKGIVREILMKRKISHIFICPLDFNTNSIIKTADAIVTCQGTVGMECSCLGIPAVVCGNAFYSGFGFTIEPKDSKQYVKTLMRLKNTKKLSASQIEKAKIVYGAYLMYCDVDMGLLDNDILDCIWGYNREINIQEAYRLINKKFNDMDFMGSSLYKEAIDYFYSH